MEKEEDEEKEEEEKEEEEEDEEEEQTYGKVVELERIRTQYRRSVAPLL